MKWDFRNNLSVHRRAFTLIEVSVALVILGMIAATVLVVVNRAMDTVVAWQTKMEAFEIARENMEKVLAQKSVTDLVEYGISEKNPDINWETTVESFYEPVSNRMWIRAVCSAGYIDDSGQEQKIEFTHWITGPNKKQVEQILQQRLREEEYFQELAESSDEQTEDTQQPDEQLSDEQQTEQDQQAEQDYEAETWKSIEKIIGPPPEGYEHWGQAPEKEFWEAVGRALSRK
ncbi:MAG: type II secretion system GspH family protein [Planctomycetes bacterium]|nr:type II secretion system GspH family protein [Planctomycetota bacterium]MBU1518161.1 type II secretion system GspH family protein [Planctomycetota bacterium]MBU2457102.1 type II secretion system GspH family protein [Planctomycetota bacterium]MBU2597437.1 type II secretion system GspH family protein [Planctomycetota bacterium]